MWNREDNQKTKKEDWSKGPVPAAPVSTTPPTLAVVPSGAPIPAARAAVAIGSSIVIKGELSGSEDLLIEGRVEGKISLPGHALTIGNEATISAEVVAKAVIVQGTITGNVTATDRFEIKSGGRVTGDVVSPKISMAEGSEFRGKVDMGRSESQAARISQNGAA